MRLSFLVVTLSLSLLAGTARADLGGYAPQRRVTGGVVASASFASLGGHADLDLLGTPLSASPEATERLSIGAEMALRLTPRWGLQVELSYATRGASSAQVLGGFGSSSGGYSLDYDLRYLELPLLVTFTLPYDGRVTQYLFAGPDLGLLLSSEISGDGYVTDPDTGEVSQQFASTEDIASDTAGFDVGVTVGAGVKLPLRRGRLVLSARYAISLRTAVEDNQLTISQGVTLNSRDLRHRALMLTAGYEL